MVKRTTLGTRHTAMRTSNRNLGEPHAGTLENDLSADSLITMSRELDGAALVGSAITAFGGLLVTKGFVSIALNILCVLLAAVVVYRYVVALRGHDHWAELRRERKRRRRS